MTALGGMSAVEEVFVAGHSQPVQWSAVRPMTAPALQGDCDCDDGPEASAAAPVVVSPDVGHVRACRCRSMERPIHSAIGGGIASPIWWTSSGSGDAHHLGRPVSGRTDPTQRGHATCAGRSASVQLIDVVMETACPDCITPVPM